LPGAAAHASYVDIFIHPAESGNNAESFWVFAVTEAAEGGGAGEKQAQSLSVWRLTIVGACYVAKGADSPGGSPRLPRSQTARAAGGGERETHGGSFSSLGGAGASPLLRRAVRGPLECVRPSAMVRIAVVGYPLDSGGGGAGAAAVCAAMIHCVQPGCTERFNLKATSMLTVGFADGWLRCWSCTFEPPPDGALADAGALHASGAVELAPMGGMDELMRFGGDGSCGGDGGSDGIAGVACTPTELVATYDGMVAVGLRSAADPSMHAVRVFDVASSGRSFGEIMTIPMSDGAAVEALAWGGSNSSDRTLYVGSQGLVLTYGQQQTDERANQLHHLPPFRLLAATPISSHPTETAGPSTICAMPSGAVVSGGSLALCPPCALLCC
jgi:hypothetical protein